MSNRRQVFIKVRVTQGEQTAWQAKAEAAGLSLSELIRRAIVQVRIWAPVNIEIERERTRELARIGNNLNQIARWANTYKEAAEAVEIIVGLLAIQRLLAPSRSVASGGKTSPSRIEHEDAH